MSRPSTWSRTRLARGTIDTRPKRVISGMSRANRVRVLRNAAVLRGALSDEGFDVPAGESQIVPLVLGDPDLAVDVCEGALQRGVFAQAIRPPTVPAGTSRLRLAAMATHTPAEMRWAAKQLAAAVEEAGATPRSHAPERAQIFVYDGEGQGDVPVAQAA